MRVVAMSYVRALPRKKAHEVRVQVPPRLIPIIGKATLSKYLSTPDKATANRLAVPWVANFLDQIERAECELRGDVGPRYTWPVQPFQPFAGMIRKTPPPQAAVVEPLSFDAMVELWVSRRGKPTSSRTRSAASRPLERLASYLGHRDAPNVTSSDLQRFLDHLIAGGAAPGTIEDQVIYIKTVFNVAHLADKLPSNPAAKLSYTGEVRDERRDFSPAERTKLLTLAREAVPVIRWSNWLSAYSGARLAELAEATTHDVEMIDGVPVFHIRLDFRAPGHTLKNKASARPFVIHSAVIAEGFLDYVASLEPGPLFPDIHLDKHGRRSTRAGRLIMEWLRGVVGIQDENAVFHSHRHGFKTLCRIHGIEEQYADAICGHVNGSIGRGYGRYPYETLQREIEKLP